MSHTLRIWLVTSNRGADTIPFLTKQLEGFLSRHPGLTIEWRLLSWTTAARELLHACKQGTLPDVFEFGTTWLGVLAHLGALAPVPDGAVASAPLAPWGQAVTLYKGQRHAVPWMLDVSCFMARSDVLAAHDVDPTRAMDWRTFRALCADIMHKHRDAGASDDGAHPKSLTFACRPERGGLHRIFPWLWAGGFSIPSLHRPPIQVFTSPEIRAGLSWIIDLMRVGEVTVEEARRSPNHLQSSFFVDGSHAFMMSNWYAPIRQLEEGVYMDGGRWPAQVIPMPEGPAGAGVFGGGSLIGVSRSSTQPDLAWELVEALLKPDVLTTWALWTGAPPAYACGFWDRTADEPSIQVLHDSLLHSQTYPVHPVWSSLEHTLAVGLSELLWYLIDHDFDAHATALAQRIDDESNYWLSYAWEVQT